MGCLELILISVVKARHDSFPTCHPICLFFSGFQYVGRNHPEVVLMILLFFFIYSYPNLKSVRELIYKRGYGKVDSRRIPLTDNSVIETVLGLYTLFVI